MAEFLSKVNMVNIVDNIEKSNTSASVICSLNVARVSTVDLCPSESKRTEHT